MSLFRLLPDTSRPEALVFDKAGRTKFILSYAFDWALTVILWIVFVGIDQIEGYRRDFSLTDTSLQYPYAVHERIPMWLLVILVGLVPLLVFAVISLGLRRSLFDFHCAFLGLVLAQALTWVATDAFKLAIGRPRPDIISRCQPAAGSVNGSPYGLSNWTVCTQLDLLKDGFRSLPSGHSSSAFAGLGFLSLYLGGKFKVFDNTGHTAPVWIAATPLIGAMLIGISRSMDYRHHATDIIAGSLLGLIIAWFSYRTYYPPLTDPKCYEPYRQRLMMFKVEDPESHDHESLPLHNSAHTRPNVAQRDSRLTNHTAETLNSY